MLFLECSTALSNSWRTLEMLLINCETNVILTWSDKFVLPNDVKATAFTITDTKLYALVVTLSTEDNATLSSFKRTINWNKYQSKTIIQAPKKII